MQDFKNSTLIDEGIIAICMSDDYISTTIISISITNTHTASMKISLLQYTGYDYSYLVKDLIIDSDETITIIGDYQKIVLEELDYLKLTSDYTGTNYLSTVVSLMNTYIPYYIPPPEPTWAGELGLFGGAYNILDVIDRITIAVKSNSIDFANLSIGRHSLTGCSDSTTGIFAGGRTATSDVIDYVIFAVQADATDFGNMTEVKYFPASCADATYAIFSGGYSATYSTEINYVTIAIKTDATNFGQLLITREGHAGASNGTTGLFSTGYNGAYLPTIEKITIAIQSDAIEWGNVTGNRWQVGCFSNYTFSFVAGGSGTTQNIIDYKVFANDANATDFGDLTVARYALAGCSNISRGVFGGGYSTYNTMDCIEMDIKSNATDFGDLTTGRREIASCSGN